MEKIYIYQLSDKELNAELHLCLGLCGCHKNRLLEMETSEWDKIIRAVKKYQGKMNIDDFRKAFDDYAFGELECERFKPTTPTGIGFLLQAYILKTFGPKTAPKKELYPDNGLPPSTDEDYYNALICVMEGKRSERHKLAYPHITDDQHLGYFREYGQMIPMAWAWYNVYRHLRKLNICDEAQTFEGQKKQIRLWLSVQYPNAKEQSVLFKTSPMFGSGLGSKLRETLE